MRARNMLKRMSLGTCAAFALWGPLSLGPLPVQADASLPKALHAAWGMSLFEKACSYILRFQPQGRLEASLICFDPKTGKHLIERRTHRLAAADQSFRIQSSSSTCPGENNPGAGPGASVGYKVERNILFLRQGEEVNVYRRLTGRQLMSLNESMREGASGQVIFGCFAGGDVTRFSPSGGSERGIVHD